MKKIALIVVLLIGTALSLVLPKYNKAERMDQLTEQGGDRDGNVCTGRA